ncbi:glycosyltransferase family 32 protein, partial [Fistulina hepatica ATCC 64428]
MQRRRALYAFLIILALVLVGTVVVLSSVTYYLAIDPSAYLSEDEVPYLSNNTRWNASDHGQLERVPRIIHQTWKTDTLPLNWQNVSQGCRDMMPDYEYMLWSDAASRDFIKRHYPWFLDTFDSYPYNIQRADVIRYFVLHYYGGVYLDLDVGCLRPVDLLLIYPVVLPETIPVGISNDLMFAEKGHPFMAQTIHNLVTFDHNYILNYPTVMFTTGPMFLSAQLSIFTSSHSNDNGIRVLPKSLYGKNAKEGEAPHSFFLHYYGSSWHADDAAFIGFLNHWGKLLMYIG